MVKVEVRGFSDVPSAIGLDDRFWRPEEILQSLRVTHRAHPDFSRHIDINWQSGPIEEVGINGAGIEDVIQVCIDRLRMFNEGDMRCRENSLAITDLESARNWLTLRTINRIQQGVEGYEKPHVS